MNVKHVMATAALLCGLATTVNAQEAGGFRVGVGIGLNVNSISNANANPAANDNVDSKVGFDLGVKGDYFFTDNVYLGTGLFFARKGWQDDYGKIHYNYLQIPVHVGYRHPITENIAIFGEFGPYFAYAVSAKYKDKYDSDDDFDVFKDYKDARRFDAGLGIHAGAEFGKFQVRLGYDFGLAKLFKTYGNQKANKNGTFTVGAAYFF